MTTKRKSKPVPAPVPAAEPKGYNGWANYETWAVNMWLTNDEGMASDLNDRAESAWTDAEDDSNTTDGIWTRSQTARFRLADALKELVGDMDPSEDPNTGIAGTLWSDLIGAALDSVDWHEMADALLRDATDDKYEPPTKDHR